MQRCPVCSATCHSLSAWLQDDLGSIDHFIIEGDALLLDLLSSTRLDFEHGAQQATSMTQRRLFLGHKVSLLLAAMLCHAMPCHALLLAMLNSA